MKKKIKIIVDFGMVLLLPLLMAYSLVGEAAHEYLGIGMFLLFIAHHILNIAWWKHILSDMGSLTLCTLNAKHIASRSININTVALLVVFCKYRSHRIESPYR